MRRPGSGLLGICLALTLLAPSTHAEPAPPGGQPGIAIIIDDIGYVRDIGLALAELPYPLTFAVLPFSPHGSDLARLAHHSGKEIMLHAPMANVHLRNMGPGALTGDMSRARLLGELVKGMASVPYCVGINNHMGSLLTQQAQPMQWVMEELALQRMYFVDSKTTASTVAWKAADDAGLDYAIRDVFLDHDRDPAAIRAAFNKTIRVAKRQGRAIAIGHPYQETLDMLREQLPRLGTENLQLVPASSLTEQGYMARFQSGANAELAARYRDHTEP